VHGAYAAHAGNRNALAAQALLFFRRHPAEVARERFFVLEVGAHGRLFVAASHVSC
jgi:hypothetical protein